MNLIEFYKRVLENVGYVIDKEDYVYIPAHGKKELVTIAGKSMVLPTMDQIESLYVKTEDGKYELSKIPFNPLSEDVIKGDSESIKKLKSCIEYRLSHSIFAIGELLITLASEPKLQKNISTDLELFLANLTKAISQGQRGGVADDKSIEKWTNIYANMITNHINSFTIYLKKKGNIDGITYTRVATITSNILDELDEHLNNLKDATSYKVSGVTLRKKDVIVFKEVFKYILENLNKNNVISVGSNDSESPTFISLFTLYLNIAKRNNTLLEYLKNINVEYYDSYYIQDLLDVKDLENIKRFKTELLDIPSDIDLTRMVTDMNNKSLIQPSPYPNTPAQVSNTTPVTSDPLLRALGGNGYQQQSQVVSWNVPQQQIQPTQPIGINSIPQPNISQPTSYYQPQQQQPFGYVPMAGGLI